MKHRSRTLSWPALLLAAVLGGPVAAQSLPVITVDSIRPVQPPPRPNSGRVLIQPGEARGALSDHAGSPGRGRGKAGRGQPSDRANLVTDDTTRGRR